MDIQHLKVFVSAFENRGFSKASEELNLRQPTISSHIKALEDEFNCKLFDRLNKTIVPTKKAEVLYGHSVELIERVNTLKKTMGNIGRDLTGKLIVGASEIPGAYLLPRIMAEFSKANPGVSFQSIISSSQEIVGRITGYKLAIGIVESKIEDIRIKYMPLIKDKLIAVTAPSMVKASRMTLREMLKLPIILQEDGSGIRREMKRFLDSKSVSSDSIKVGGIFGSTDAIKQAVKAGIGVSILSKFSVADELKNCMLKEIELTDIVMERQIYIAIHAKRTLPRLYNAFLAHIVAPASIQERLYARRKGHGPR